MTDVTFDLRQSQNSLLRQPRAVKDELRINFVGIGCSKTPDYRVTEFFEYFDKADSELFGNDYNCAKGDVNKLIFAFAFPLLHPSG